MPAATELPNPFDRDTAQVFGHVTTDNIEALERRVRKMLFEGDGRPRPYTKICSYAYADYRPEVFTTQLAEQIKLSNDDGRAALTVIDTYGVWSIDTEISTPELRRLRNGEALRKSMYVVMVERQMQIKLRTPQGLKAWWHVALERD